MNQHSEQILQRLNRIGVQVLERVCSGQNRIKTGAEPDQTRTRLSNMFQPRGEIVVADGDARTAGVDVRETATEPVADHRRALGRDLERGVCPAADQSTLQLAIVWRQLPVAARALNEVPGGFEAARGDC